MMEVRVRVFAGLREELGTGLFVQRVPSGSTTGELVDLIAAEHASVARLRSVVRTGVNDRYVPGDHVLQEGDEVALITPVSGG